MAAATQIPLAEYLETTFCPDREYLDGELQERNAGTWNHARIQTLLAAWFGQHEGAWHTMTATNWRMAISPTRIRIPDLTVVAAGPQPAVLDTPPLLVIEILSPADTYTDTQKRTRDYQAMGIQNLWIIDPETRTGRICTGTTWTEATRLEVPGTPIQVDLPTLFASLQHPL